MPTPQLSERTALEAVSAVKKYGSVTEAAQALGVARTTLQHRYTLGLRLGKPETRAHVKNEFTVEPPQDEDFDVGDLLAWRKAQFERKRQAEEQGKLVRVRVKIDGPYGIAHFGDPHLDDDGTDIQQVEHDADVVARTPGLFGATVGDVTNNWVGRLAKLYAEQSTTAKQAWMLAEWWFEKMRGKLLYAVGGNHDAWSGQGDPLKWIARQVDALYQSSEARLLLCSPNGVEVVCNVRHDFSGHSIYNPAHGQMKAIHFGNRDHITVSGHKHTSGYGVLKSPETGRICHAFQVASYKLYDRYAKEKGFRDMMLGPSVVTVIDPSKPDTHPDMVKAFWDVAEGADYLTYLRSKLR